MTDEDRGPLTDEDRLVQGAEDGGSTAYRRNYLAGGIADVGSAHALVVGSAHALVEREDDVLALLRFAFRKIGEEIR
jgi:hypothetical protein